MSSNNVKLTLPPEGTTARNLALNFICRLSIDPSISVEISENTVTLSSISLDELLSTVNGTIKAIGKELENKILLKKLRDLPVHKNDYKLLSEILGSKVGKGSRFSDVTQRILLNTNLTLEDISEWSKVTTQLKGGKIQILLGSSLRKNYPLPQPLLTERFEASHMFMHGLGGRSIKIRATEPWLIMLLAGFALSYGGIADGIIHYIYAPEEVVRGSTENKEVLATIMDESNGFIPFITCLNVPSTPRVAYILYLASQLVLEYSGRELLDMLETMIENRVLTFEAHRVRFDGNTFTMVEKFSGDLYQIVSKIINLNKETLQWLRNVSKRCLFVKYDPSLYTIYANLCNLLYNALVGSGSIIDALYYAGRVVLEKELSLLEAQGKAAEAKKYAKKLRRIFQDMLTKLIVT